MDEQIEGGQHHGGDRREHEPLSPVVVTAYLSIAMTVIMLIFTSGYNYRGLVEGREAQEKLAATLISDYVRKDVNEQQMNNIQTKLDEIVRQIAEMKRDK